MATSYSNNGATGDRRMEIVTTGTVIPAGIGSGPYEALINGNFTADTTNSYRLSNANSAGVYFQFDFGVAAAILIDEIKVYADNTNNQGTWKWQGSNNLSSWTDIGSSFTLSGSTTGATKSIGGSTAYRAYRLTMVSGSTDNTTFFEEIEFKIEDQTPQTSRCSWYNTGGFGSRGGFITGSTNMTLTSGVVNNALDSNFTANSTNSFQMQNGSNTGFYVRFDFGVGASVAIDTLGWYQSGSATHGTWKVQGSNDASSWTDIGSSFTLGGAIGLNRYDLGGNTTGYRYYQIVAVSGSASSTPFIEEIEFRIKGLGGGGGGGSAKSVIIIGTCG